MKLGTSRVLAVRCCLGLAIAARLGSQSSEEQVLRRLETDKENADRLLARENQTVPQDRAVLSAQRITAFRILATEQRQYILQWIPDTGSLHYLIASYYLCDFLERGELGQNAIACFDFCQKNARVDGPDAKVGDPPAAMGPLVRQRYADLVQRTVLLNRAEGRGDVDPRNIVYRGKGDIALGTYPPPPSFTTAEAMTLTMRLSVGGDARQAVNSLKTLLEQDAALRPVTVEANSPDWIAFGVAGAAQYLTPVSQQLKQANQELTRRYFDSSAARPTMWVFANLAGSAPPETVPVSVTPPPFGPGPSPAPPGIPAPVPDGLPPIPDPSTFPRLPVPAQGPAGPQGAQRPDTPARPGPPDLNSGLNVQQVGINPAAQQAPTPRQQGQQQQSPRPPAPMEQRGAPRLDQQFISREEAVGRALSQKLHFRQMENLEGYYEPLDHSLVLRKGIIDPRGQVYFGTGMHELTHARMQVDFPSAPIWLNEGMAALHEEMTGWTPLNNYRLYMVRSALDLGRMPALTAILDPASAAWQSMYLPLAAAASRYFCFYLAQRSASPDALPMVYRQMRDHAGEEPMPLLATHVLERVVGLPLAQIEVEYRAFISRQDTREIEAKWGRLARPASEFVSQLLPMLVPPPAPR